MAVFYWNKMWYSDVMQERGGSALEVSFEVLQRVNMKISVFCDVQSVASMVQVGAIHPLQV